VNATLLARRIDTTLFLADYKMRVSYNARIHAYILHYGKHPYRTVYRYTTYYYPATRHYAGHDITNTTTVRDTWNGTFREFVYSMARAYAEHTDRPLNIN
jgi:hypothetical protein